MNINFNSKTVLVLAPHTDDGELGLGGTISKMIDEGANVHYVAFSTAQESVPEGFPRNILTLEVKLATSKLGIKPDNLIMYNYEVRKLSYQRQDILEKLILLRKKLNPDIVFIPSLSDIHQDHKTVSEEGVRAFKKASIFGYELIWNNLTFNNQAFISLNKKHIDLKVNALKQYKSQGKRDYLSEDFIYALARARGVQIGVKYSESFEVIRLML